MRCGTRVAAVFRWPEAQGTALVIHAGKDDYNSDPAGDAGGRIACGVIE